MLLLVFMSAEVGKTCVPESVPDEMGGKKLPEDRKGVSISVDGKTIRSTGKMDSYDSPLHIVSAQLCELGITLASKSVDGKSNETPAVQELLKELDISGCMMVADALILFLN